MKYSFLSRLMLLTLLLPLPALAWWNDDWDYRKQIRFDLSATGADTADTVTDVPMLIRLSAGNFAYFGDTQPDGADLRFIAADDVTPLPYYLERFDGVNQIALVWVQVPQLTAGANSDFIYMYYGNPDAAAASAPPTVFDAESVLVYDFSQEQGRLRDRTGYSNDPSASTVDSVASSLIAGGAEFAGTETVEIPASPELAVRPAEGLTTSLWVRPAEIPAEDATLVSSLTETGGSLVLGLRGSYAFLSVDFGGNPVEIVADTLEIAAGEWTHIAGRIDGDEATLFVNGEQLVTGTTGDGELNGSWTLGDPAKGYVGQIDQFRIDSAPRLDARIKLIARAEAPFSTVLTYGEDAQREGGGGESYIAVTLRNVTVDGWVVILILAVMAVISWVVMLMKSMLLSRVERQNNRFLADYRKLVGNPLALDRDVPELDTLEEESVLSAALEDEESYHPSTLFPLYHVGAAEVKKRVGQLSPAAGAERSGLTGKSISAIRASVDGTLVRQRQKLNRLMVLLTIAISGGPFLGLLGTVVGVMITFAAIAASGDVNVNSIAPGIAAALVATVAGLIVAIPALFGYNWLGSRIKDIDANTQVFADEFINQIAEHYG